MKIHVHTAGETFAHCGVEVEPGDVDEGESKVKVCLVCFNALLDKHNEGIDTGHILADGYGRLDRENKALTKENQRLTRNYADSVAENRRLNEERVEVLNEIEYLADKVRQARG